MLDETNVEVKIPLVLQIDNKSVINLVRNPILRGRSKHIEAIFHLLIENVT